MQTFSSCYLEQSRVLTPIDSCIWYCLVFFGDNAHCDSLVELHKCVNSRRVVHFVYPFLLIACELGYILLVENKCPNSQSVMNLHSPLLSYCKLKTNVIILGESLIFDSLFVYCKLDNCDSSVMADNCVNFQGTWIMYCFFAYRN